MAKAKEILISSFLELIENEEYDKFSVTNLVAECGISRQTFYYHFNDIEDMLRWSFEKDVKHICDMQKVNKWYDSAELFLSMFEKYDTLLRKGLNSNNFIFIYNLVYDSFYTYIKEYLRKKQGDKPVNEEADFLVSFSAGSYCGLIIKEIQKPQSDYPLLLEKVKASFKQ